MVKKYIGIAVLILIASSFLLMGCTGNSNPNGGNGTPDQGGPGGGFRKGTGFRNGSFGPGERNGSFEGNGSRNAGFRNGTFENLTSEQRAQLQQERMQSALAACNGKSDGDACTIQGPREDIRGSCVAATAGLECTFQQQENPNPG